MKASDLHMSVPETVTIVFASSADGKLIPRFQVKVAVVLCFCAPPPSPRDEKCTNAIASGTLETHVNATCEQGLRDARFVT